MTSLLPDADVGADTDIALVRAAQAGDVTALALLLEHHRAGMRAVALSILGPGPDADDAVQDAVLVALRRIGDVREPAAAGAWLRMVVRNQCRGLLREARRLVPIDELAPYQDPAADPGEFLELHSMQDWVWEAIEQLSPALRLPLVLRHPLAYTQHRLGHFNSNLRFWVDAHQPDADPPLESEPNQYNLGAPANAAGGALIDAAHAMALSPLGWPVAWLALAAGLVWAAKASPDPQARIGRALALSALCMSSSYAVISIASDLRYHLWSMVAAALALILLLDTRALDRRRGFIAGGALVAVIAIGTIARLGAASPVSVPLPPALTAPPAP